MSAPQTSRKSARLASKTPVSKQEPSSSGKKSAAKSSRRAKRPTKSQSELAGSGWVCTPPPRFAFKERFRRDKGKDKAINASRIVLASVGGPAVKSPEKCETVKEVQEKQAAMIEYLGNTLAEHEQTLAHVPFPEEFHKLITWFQEVQEGVEIRDLENNRLREENRLLNCALDELKRNFRRVETTVEEIRRKVEGLPPKYQRMLDPNGKPFAEWRRSPLSAGILPSRINTELAERRGRAWRDKSPIVIETECSAESSTDATLVNQEGTRKRQREGEDETLGATTNAKPRSEVHTEGKTTQDATAQDDSSAPPAKKRRIRIKVALPEPAHERVPVDGQ